MTQLTTLRQRIKSIETIKKITHAMRLISMSIHSRLNQKNKHLNSYQQSFQRIWNIVKKNSPTQPMPKESQQIPIVLLIGSQKGLCGSFNNSLFKFFEKNYLASSQRSLQLVHLITVGKLATEYIVDQGIQPITSFNTFNSANFVEIANSIAQLLLNYNTQSATAISNIPISFFVQQPTTSQIIPLKNNNQNQQTYMCNSQFDYIFEQDPYLLVAAVHKMLLTVRIQELLYKSLLAEQAARFLSMDTSTRNAESALDDMKLEYNKVRQAIITKELTELTSNI